MDCKPDSHSYHDLLQKRVARRKILQCGVGAGIFGVLRPKSLNAYTYLSSLTFHDLPHDVQRDMRITGGYEAKVLMRWGDPLKPNLEPFHPATLTADDQKQRFGVNNDFISYLPFGGEKSDHGLLCVNHEYPNPHLMWEKHEGKWTKQHAEIMLAALGHTVMEIKRNDKHEWKIVTESPFNRRINGLSTLCEISGPLKGHPRMQTSKDPLGQYVIGTLGNCGGGTTQWRTILTAEENVDDYFSGKPSGAQREHHESFGIKGKARYPYMALADKRFDVEKEPNEPNRFGWVVEIDPFDPTSKPIKRTALGRFKHEAATMVLNSDGRVVVYMGDDEQFQYLYKFVSHGRVNQSNKKENMRLLDHGTLFVAKFAEKSVEWMPLKYGKAPLNAANGFSGQADVMLETRRAAKLLGATEMDRPEDVETNPYSGNVYVVMTNNSKRLKENIANPRNINLHGHIIEMVPPLTRGEIDHAATTFSWDIFMLGGDPDSFVQAGWYQSQKTTKSGWLSCPDNITFDKVGRMWIATDGQSKTIDADDALYGCDTAGRGRGVPKHFFNAPQGAEVTGPCFTPDNTTLFLSVQHPAENTERGEDVTTRWPDFDQNMPPRSSIVVITKKDRDVIGG